MVLYPSPTKALAADQLRAMTALDVQRLRPATYGGDLPYVARDSVRAHANWVLTTPDMLHRGMLPAHGRWAPYFRRLRYVVVDECHSCRGLFGAHGAQILRRLRRVCASYGSSPVFLFASPRRRPPRRGAVGSPGWSGCR